MNINVGAATRQRFSAKVVTLAAVVVILVGTVLLLQGQEQAIGVRNHEAIVVRASACARELENHVKTLKSEESMRKALSDLKTHAVVKGVDGSQVSSVVELLKSKHKIGSVGEKLVFLFPTNLVVTAHGPSCQVTGMYAGRNGKMHPQVDKDALSAKLIAADKGPSPPPPPPPPNGQIAAHAHDKVSPWFGVEIRAHWMRTYVRNDATPPNPGVTIIRGWDNHHHPHLGVFLNSLRFDFHGIILGPFGHQVVNKKESWIVVVDTGACVTEVKVHYLGAPHHLIKGIEFHIQGPNVDRWRLGGAATGSMSHYQSGGSCLKGVGMRHGPNFLRQVQFVFGYWCPGGSDCSRFGYVGRTPCAGGHFAPSSYNRKGCLAANKGYYAPAGSIREQICMPGTYQDKRGQASCLDSPPGHFVGVPGAHVPSICRKPYYQPKARQVQCLTAAPGHFVNTDGAVKQIACAPGHYQPMARGTTPCLMCAPGTFQSGTGQATCMRALPGHFVKGSGAIKESACLAGTYQPGVGQTGCFLASKGHSVGGSGWAREQPCKIGFFQPRAGQTSCVRNPKGGGVSTSTKLPVSPVVSGGLAVTNLIGSETLDSGYNLFRGVGAIAVIARRLGYFTNRMKRNVRVNGAVFFVPDQAEYVHNPQCLSSQWSAQYTQSYSVKESTSIARKFSMSLSGSVLAGHACPPLWSLGAATSTSLFYGNSMEMRQSRAQAAQGYSYSSNSFVDSTLYDVHVDWKRPTVAFEFDGTLKNMISSINTDKSGGKGLNKLVMTLIESFGSHVIAEATFGSQCSMTTYMESSATQAAVSSFLSQQSSLDFSKKVFTWFMSPTFQGAAHSSVNIKTQSRSSHSFSGTFSSGRKYSVKNVQCKGYLKNNLCDGRWSAKNDNPAMIEYIPLPIWEVSGAGWKPRGQRNMLWVLRDLERALLKCNKIQCGNVGVCTMKRSFWDNMVATGAWDGDFFSPAVEKYGLDSIMWNTGCVCVGGMDSVTNKCAEPGSLPLSPPVVSRPYEWVPAQRLGCADACKLGKYGYAPYYANAQGKDGICSTQIGSMKFVGSNFDVGMDKPSTHQCLVNLVVPGQKSRNFVGGNYECLCADPSRVVRQVSFEQACYVMCPRIGKKPVAASGYVLNGKQTDLCIAMEPKWNLRGGYTDQNKCNIWHKVSATGFECLCF